MGRLSPYPRSSAFICGSNPQSAIRNRVTAPHSPAQSTQQTFWVDRVNGRKAGFVVRTIFLAGEIEHEVSVERELLLLRRHKSSSLPG
jgi:hypothetical protein